MIGLWSVVFLCLPIKLMRPKTHPLIMMSPFLLFWGLSLLTNPLSSMATKTYRHSHCGIVTYTGVLYPLAPYLSDAYTDDLEARNQLCWLRKIVSKVPEKFESENEVNTYLKIMDERLQEPEFKYRVSLPLILIYLGKTVHAWNVSTATLDQFTQAQLMMKGVPFWTEQYSQEISKRRYSSWDWPYSALTQAEYGFIEDNLGKFQIMIEKN